MEKEAKYRKPKNFIDYTGQNQVLTCGNWHGYGFSTVTQPPRPRMKDQEFRKSQPTSLERKAMSVWEGRTPLLSIWEAQRAKTAWHI
jgi:hypothetical protein